MEPLPLYTQDVGLVELLPLYTQDVGLVELLSLYPHRMWQISLSCTVNIHLTVRILLTLISGLFSKSDIITVL